MSKIRVRLNNREKQLLLTYWFGKPAQLREQLNNQRRKTADFTATELNEALGGLSMESNHNTELTDELDILCEKLECELLDRGLLRF